VTEDERTLLLTVARWCLGLEASAAEAMGEADHPKLKKLREMIDRVETGAKPK